MTGLIMQVGSDTFVAVKGQVLQRYLYIAALTFRQISPSSTNCTQNKPGCPLALYKGKGACCKRHQRSTRLQEAVASTLKLKVLLTSAESLKPSANAVSATSVEQAWLHRGVRETMQLDAAACRLKG